ncbi:uncharacterized protein LOC108959705 [Eucalyptus grandis]|uniref:uncharacterized protein LOC108959705 n=1 Tax=Eucalyptus grandis TaxID=71139 RepID=UPI00192E9004|nr:uncharacterized protein LOC108959705 [Eucalyptus grandis]
MLNVWPLIRGLGCFSSRQMSIMHQNLTGKNWRSKFTRLQCSCSNVDEDSEGNESASQTEVEAYVDKKAARKENKRKVKEEKREARKNKVSKVVKKRSWPKPTRLGSHC